MDIILCEQQTKKFYEYMKLLIDWNEKMNLTSIIESEGIISKHFVDSLTIQKYIKESELLIDIGTGAGFPGIPLKIVNEGMKITLLDSLNKRITFLKEIIRELELKDIVGIHGRAEELGRNKEHRERYDIAVARAVASLSSLLEYMAPFVKVGGKLICMKGPKLEEELEKSKNAIKILGLEIEKIERTLLPDTDIERNILILKKVKKMPEEYPRRAINIKKATL